MANKPILVMQMQRMGDLILTYPLMLWLQRNFPDYPVHVVAEQAFSGPLGAVSPQVTYHSWEDLTTLSSLDFHCIINLSIQDKAAILAAQLKCDHIIGPVQEKTGAKYIYGHWQLYRASLVQNNRYNRFHWAELNALDIIDRTTIATTRFDAPRTLPQAQNSVGLFIGASERTKRPSATFWAELAERLIRMNMRPVLFGGPAEVALADKIISQMKAPILNYCGKLGLDQLSLVGQTLQLFITPDTGPMHLAAWTGLKTLNISMGNVNPWETGPYQPYHYIVRSGLDCAYGCWSCTENETHCHAPITPRAVAATVQSIIFARTPAQAGTPDHENLHTYTSGKSDNGLYCLHNMHASNHHHAQLSLFWQHFFLALFEEQNREQFITCGKENLNEIKESYPQLYHQLLKTTPQLFKQLKSVLTARTLPADFWSGSHQFVKPFTGYLQLALQNEDFSDAGTRIALLQLEIFASLFS